MPRISYFFGIAMMMHKVNRITRVKPVRDHVLKVWFSSGESGLFDVAPYLKGPMYRPLRDREYFLKVDVDAIAGTMHWPNGADFCPDIVYEQAIVAAAERKGREAS